MTDSATVIRSRFLRLAKLIHTDARIDDYDKVKTIDLFDVAVPDLDALRDLLVRLLPKPSCALVFGGIVDPSRTRGVRRLAYPDPETGDQATLRPVPHRWCLLDSDGVARPDDVPASDLPACAALAIERLPPAFHTARCIVLASAGHGIKPGCRLRLGFWLDRPTTGDELGFWLRGHSVDPCTFRPAQPIYVAAPVFIGREDHLPCRIADIPGSPAVAVPASESLRPPARAPVSQENREAASSDDDIQRTIDDALARVRSASDGAKHYTLRNQARLLGGIQTQARFTDAEAVRWLVDALPSTAKDTKAAKKTARWGLDVGRTAPVTLRNRERKAPDPRRKETTRTAFRLLRAGIAGSDVLATLHRLNEQRRDPLSRDDIGATALWVARQLKGGADA